MKTTRNTILLAVAAAATCGWPQMLSASVAAATTATMSDRPRMEVVFVLDTTGSMGGMIAGAKRKIWAIANKLKSAEPTPEIRFGLVGYRDRGDEYVTRVHDLSANLDDVSTQLQAFLAGGGGDEPEAVNEALRCAVHDLHWSGEAGVLRVVFLVGDARPHMDYNDDVKYPETCRLAGERGVLINTLQCGQSDATESVWRDIARRTGGTYAQLLQSGGAMDMGTRYDGDIVGLNLALDATIIPYGTPADRENATRNRALLTSLSAEGVADRSSFLGKTEFGAILVSKVDLVVEILSGRMGVEEVDPGKLDPKLAALPTAERNALITGRVEERGRLQKLLLDLAGKRDVAVAAKLESRAGEDGALELSAFEVLETQAEGKGFRFPKKP
jgi:Mg-chelatase subunit ChlD